MTRSNPGVLLVPQFGTGKLIIVDSNSSSIGKQPPTEAKKTILKNSVENSKSITDTKSKKAVVITPSLDNIKAAKKHTSAAQASADERKSKKLLSRSMESSKTKLSDSQSKSKASLSTKKSILIDEPQNAQSPPSELLGEKRRSNGPEPSAKQIPTPASSLLNNRSNFLDKMRIEKKSSVQILSPPNSTQDKDFHLSRGKKGISTEDSSVVDRSAKLIAEASHSSPREKAVDRESRRIEKTFSEYRHASDLRRQQQENQINAYAKEVFNKSLLLSMYEQMTRATIEPTGHLQYKWTQKGAFAEIESSLEYLPDMSMYRYTPVVLPSHINQMHEGYQAFKDTMLFDATQLDIFYQRVANIVDFSPPDPASTAHQTSLVN